MRARSSNVDSVSGSSSRSSGDTADTAASSSRARLNHSSTATDCTGILLVGGAGARFGSPKPLARLDGETLAEKAWRTLSWCDERLAVGKAADALDLPFPVVDDGTLERAPVFGVVAGLRTARHDVCVVLPVDCPLVTEEVLRELAAAVAVVQTGPLPGAYTKAMLPALEVRIARGELSLRGVNPRVVQVDPELLVNVNTPDELARLR